MNASPEQRFHELLPDVSTVTRYQRRWLRPDLIAGLTIWTMLVPQSLGYATLAGLPPVAGLYAAIGAVTLYWLWGSSRELNVGAESTIAIMVATIVQPMATSGSDEYVGLVATLALFVGIVLIIGGLLRIGRIADFLSRPVLAGYILGSGILIIVSQLPDLLGVEVDTEPYLTEVGAIARNLDLVSGADVAFGLVTVAVVLGCRRYAPAVPGALLAVVGSMVVVALADVDVAVVGRFPSGLPVPAVPDVTWDQARALIGPAFAVALLVYPDSVLTARSLGQVAGYHIRPNREFFGIGVANLGSGLLGSLPVNGCQSRSFVAVEAGARSQVANLVAIAMTLVTLIALAPVFDQLPLATLAGVVLVAGIGLIDPAEFARLWRYRRTEFWMGVITAVAVLTLGMLIGILVAVGLSLLVVVLRAANPSVAVLGQVEGTDTFRDVADHDDTVVFPGLVIYRFDAPLFFANAARLREDVIRLVDDADVPVTRVVLDCESMHDIDSTGAQTLVELLDGLDRRGTGLVLARVRSEVRDELATIGIEDRLAGRGIYLEIDDAVGHHLEPD